MADESVALGFKRNGIALSLSGEEDDIYLRKELKDAWHRLGIPDFRSAEIVKNLKNEGPQTIEELINSLEPPKGRVHETDDWDVGYADPAAEGEQDCGAGMQVSEDEDNGGAGAGAASSDNSDTDPQMSPELSVLVEASIATPIVGAGLVEGGDDSPVEDSTDALKF